MKETTNIGSTYLCHCMKITAPRFQELLRQTPSPSFASMKEQYGVGSVCSACELEAKGAVADFLILNPGAARAGQRKPPTGLREELGYAYRELRGKIRGKLGLGKRKVRVAAPTHKDYHTGIFFLRKGELETRLALSNLPFPEHRENANGPSVTFRATLYGEDGGKLASSETRTLPNHGTVSLSASDLFPELRGDFVGGLYVDFDQLRQTGSLRTYGIFTGPGARCHFHDKFGLADDPGFYLNVFPFEPGETCWFGLTNCQPRAYESDVHVETSQGVQKARLKVPAMGALWMKLADLFPGLAVPPEGLSPAIVWLENPQHVMLYFFWQHTATGHWIAQHH